VDVATLLAAKGSDVHTVDASTSIKRAVEALRVFGIGALVVLDDESHLVGVVSDRDVVVHLAERGPGILDDAVGTVMSTAPPTCTPATTMIELMALMTERRNRHVPVLVDGHLAGIVSIGDVVKARLGELERERRDLLEYVSAR
jgi:CBS domain-containing protein